MYEGDNVEKCDISAGSRAFTHAGAKEEIRVAVAKKERMKKYIAQAWRYDLGGPGQYQVFAKILAGIDTPAPGFLTILDKK